VIPEDCESNYHLFYVILPTAEQRDQVLEKMRLDGIRAVFHYVPLHSSPKGRELVGDVRLPLTEDLSERLLRMPLYFEITDDEIGQSVASLLAAIAVTAAKTSV